MSGHILLAQPALEFAAGSGTATTGSTIANQVVTFQNNTNNPTGNSFTAFTPTTTVTYSLSNEQYPELPSQNPNKASVSFGATNNNGGSAVVGVSTFTKMNYISAAPYTDFSSIPSTINQGISVDSNYGVELFTSAMGLANNGYNTLGEYTMATLTLTFNVPVTNPVLQLVGIGGYYNPGGGQLGFTSELQLMTPGVTMSELSGSPELHVTATYIRNTATHPSSTTGSGAASGSILVSGTNISQLVFQVLLRGDGGNTKWGASGEHTGDAWVLGVSMETSLFVLPLKITDFTAQAQSNTALLQWSAAAAANTDHFDVEYSQDGTNWESIGNVNVSGNPSMATNYSYVQYNPAAGNAYYRIAQVATDGSYSYTDVQRLAFGQTGTTVNCYPNPVRSQVTIACSSSVKALQVMSIDGRLLQMAAGFRSGESIDLSAYPAGIYLVVVHNSDGTSQTVKVQKI